MSLQARLAKTAFGILTAAVLAIGAPVPALAQELPTPRILVIDLSHVMTNSTAMQGIQNQVEERQAELERQMQERESELRKADEALSQERGELSDEAFEERRRELETEFAQYQRQFAEQLESMDEIYAEAVGEVEVELLRIADELASEYGANMVMPKSTLLLVHEDFNKTDEALEQLNKRRPSVSITP